MIPTSRSAALAAGLSVAPAAAFAHAFGQRYDLPLPLGFYLAGAGLAVALSFLGSFALMRPVEVDRLSILIPASARLGRIAKTVLRAVALAIFALVIATALFGPESPTRNFSVIFVWVAWWVGFTLLTALLVDLWSVANPFRQIAAFALRPIAARDRTPPASLQWLSVLGLVFLSWTELVSSWSEDPRAMAVLILAYLIGLVAGAALFGVEKWFDTADPLTRLFGLLGRAAPLAPAAGGLRLRIPASGLIGVSMSVAGAVFVVTLVAIVLFDGLSETPFWAAILQWLTDSQTLRPWLLDLRAGGVDLIKLIRTIGLLTTIALATLMYTLLSVAIRRAAGGERSLGEVFTGFAPSILPIAVAYHLAHYVFFLMLAGQLVLPAATDPFGLGWRPVAGSRGVIDVGVMTAEDVWWIAAISLVIGHGLSVFVAHAQAMRLFSTRRRAILSQLPMMVFMVSLTSLSLWILAQPVVE